MVPEVANVPDYLIGLTPDALQGVRLGYPANLNGADLETAGNDVPTGILEKMQETVALLESLGATVVQDFDLPLIVGDYLAADYSNVLSADFKVDLAEYLATVEYATLASEMHY
jgi:amidase